MRYYEIIEAEGIRNVSRIKNIKGTEDIFSEQNISAELRPKSHETIVDYMTVDYPIISNNMREVLEIYSEEIHEKRIYFPHTGYVKRKWRYWMIFPKILHALSDDSEISSNGIVTKPVLLGDAICCYRIFSVLGLKRTSWFARLEVVESLYRYGITGFAAKEVMIKE